MLNKSVVLHYSIHIVKSSSSTSCKTSQGHDATTTMIDNPTLLIPHLYSSKSSHLLQVSSPLSTCSPVNPREPEFVDFGASRLNGGLSFHVHVKLTWLWTKSVVFLELLGSVSWWSVGCSRLFKLISWQLSEGVVVSFETLVKRLLYWAHLAYSLHSPVLFWDATGCSQSLSQTGMKEGLTS